jgi:hypothetical protein
VSPLAIIAIVLGVLIVVFFIGGLIAARRHADAVEPDLRAHVAAADRALEAARAVDKGWDVVQLEEAARAALAKEAPEFRYDTLHLVLVDDRPGTSEDRAEFLAAGPAGVVSVGVSRHNDVWDATLLA